MQASDARDAFEVVIEGIKGRPPPSFSLPCFYPIEARFSPRFLNVDESNESRLFRTWCVRERSERTFRMFDRCEASRGKSSRFLKLCIFEKCVWPRLFSDKQCVYSIIVKMCNNDCKSNNILHSYNRVLTTASLCLIQQEVNRGK